MVSSGGSGQDFCESMGLFRGDKYPEGASASLFVRVLKIAQSIGPPRRIAEQDFVPQLPPRGLARPSGKEEGSCRRGGNRVHARRKSW